MTEQPSRAGQRKGWSGSIVTVVAECPGWVFVMPETAGRPFSIAAAHWDTLELLPDAR